MDTRNIKREDSGRVLADFMRQFMYDLKVDDGLNAVGYTNDDIPELVKGTLPQVFSFVCIIVTFLFSRYRSYNDRQKPANGTSMPCSYDI